MRAVHALFAIAAGGAGTLDATAAAVCSVFDNRPCAPTVCSVFDGKPCQPEVQYPIGPDLRLTIESAGAGGRHDEPTPERKLDTLREMFAALRACWVPPPRDASRPGMQMSIRFAFKRTGEIVAPPRVTYVTPDAPREMRERYRSAVDAALERCTPLPLSKGLGGAVAGRPIAIRFIDNRT